MCMCVRLKQNGVVNQECCLWCLFSYARDMHLDCIIFCARMLAGLSASQV